MTVKLKLHIYLSTLLISLQTIPAKATAINDVDTKEYSVRVREIARGLGVPWGMTFLSEQELLISERSGQLKLINISSGKVNKINGVPSVWSRGQGGLLDIQTSPYFDTDQWIYLTYSKPVADGAATTLARFKLDKGNTKSWQDLLVTQSASSGGRHFGSRITFDNQGHVFFGVGDRGDRDNGQNTKNHAATIVRLNLDGTTPKDNPFINDDNVLNEIWSYGHRNPQGLTYNHITNRLWSIEHGPRGGDEINLVQKGKNYGWPVISYGKEYWGPISVGEGTHKEGMEQPIKYYIPSIAPGSLMIYQGLEFPKWQGNLFAGALALTHINRVTLNDKGEAVGEERLLDDWNQRIRQIITDAKGRILFSTDTGKIYRIERRQ